MAEHGRRRRNIARFLAPLALMAVGAAVAIVVLGFAEDQDDGGGRGSTTTEAGRQTTREDAPARRQRRPFYRVKLNDTLGLIAEKTGIRVERLQQLNPELDPQNLIVGQRVKLRE